MSNPKHDRMLLEDMAKFFDDPLGFVLYAYHWGEGDLQGFDGPDTWQVRFLEDLGREIKKRGFDGTLAVDPIRMGRASGHGIGKSALVAWLVHFIMSTRPDANGVITANTYDQLQSKTFARLAEWTRRCITKHWFEVSTGGLWFRHKDVKGHPTWRVDGQTCKEENSEAFAGLHAATSTPFFIFDEGSAIPDKIWEVAQGGLTDGEPMFFGFGNPTRNTGFFRELFPGGRYAKRWLTDQIDARNCKMGNKSLFQEWVEDYGEDSDYVKVRVRGMFPSLSLKGLISKEDVDSALGKHLRPDQYNFAPVILSCDPAWEGDDELVIGKRQGLAFSILRVIPKNDNDMQVATILAQLEDEHKADAVFIDAGFGTGIISAGRTLNRNWQGVWFSAKPSDTGCVNKRAEMWKLMRDWLKQGGAIPDDKVLYSDLIGPEIVARMDGKLQLEAKKDMKRRGLPSPGRGDALALTFAAPVASKRRANRYGVLIDDNPMTSYNYDPNEVHIAAMGVN